MKPKLNTQDVRNARMQFSRFEPRGRLKTELAPKSWTLIKAYSGALCKLGSVCDRTQLFQFQTATLPVVVIHIVIYLLHQFVHRQFSCVIETLRLQYRKEAFHRCISQQQVQVGFSNPTASWGRFCRIQVSDLQILNKERSSENRFRRPFFISLYFAITLSFKVFNTLFTVLIRIPTSSI